MTPAKYWAAPDGARIAYRTTCPGAAHTLVLLHGLASNASRWWHFLAHTSLDDRWNIITLDRRGQGDSLWRGANGMDYWCDDIRGVLDAEHIETAVVGGHCQGANIALVFAVRHAARCSGLVLIEPMPRVALAGSLRTVARLRALWWVLRLVVRMGNALGLYRRNLPKLDLHALDLKTRAALAASSDAKVPEDFAAPLADLVTTPLASYLGDLLAVTAPLPDFKLVAQPALVLLSARSHFTDVDATERELARMPDVETQRLDAEHWIPTEQPDAMRESIDSWLSRRFPASGGAAATVGT